MSSIKDTLILLALIAIHYIERVSPSTGKLEGIAPGKPFQAPQEEAEFLIAAGAARLAEAEHRAGKASAGHKTAAREPEGNGVKTPNTSNSGEDGGNKDGGNDDEDEDEDEQKDTKPAAASTLELPALKERATALGLTFPGNVTKAKLLKLVEEAEAKAAEAGAEHDEEDGLI
ncbi:hypothetical protein [Bacteriophage Phobos]|uniref:Uncharacterized protein n=1 Tax=Bacteriophage Phobos TaxID=2662138 RepID=A0A5Q2UAD3_9CAUD|nr:hypothetical protein JT319_gp25 [Bacteriophage Phobos]QGH44994.1 hypothetical protein [Bacteriophage Phobos]WPK42390.1 hypothetical protein [Pseudomonas phage Ppu-503]